MTQNWSQIYNLIKFFLFSFGYDKWRKTENSIEI